MQPWKVILGSTFQVFNIFHLYGHFQNDVLFGVRQKDEKGYFTSISRSCCPLVSLKVSSFLLQPFERGEPNMTVNLGLRPAQIYNTVLQTREPQELRTPFFYCRTLSTLASKYTYRGCSLKWGRHLTEANTVIEQLMVRDMLDDILILMGFLSQKPNVSYEMIELVEMNIFCDRTGYCRCRHGKLYLQYGTKVQDTLFFVVFLNNKRQNPDPSLDIDSVNDPLQDVLCEKSVPCYSDFPE